ncbi:class I adenylate-forming enzyme family protein [Leifsonia sp. Root112D2]|uniref:class I adenylate-forming enzyme family protein n=1 Tax=Leifsonia sp. Root112D2 TaxID=1736426 RepID=UPI000701F0D7|nr:class I adenylate-forming enzyme family protein [Leifsonia sp. Root112D2]KQV06441.1 hypothetical protein ASC63_03075 [Leifsonia sp. Root112D2]
MSAATRQLTMWSALEEALDNQVGATYTIDDHALTLVDVHRRAEVLAERLRTVGVGSGDRVLIAAGARAEWVALFFAVLRLGAIIVPLNTRERADGLRHVIGKSAPGFVVTVDPEDPLDGAVGWQVLELAGVQDDQGIRLNEGSLRIHRRAGDAGARTASTTGEQPAIVLFTSGSTGRPKGAVLRQSPALRAAATTYSSLELESQDVMFSPLPFHHAGGLFTALLVPLVAGASSVVQSRFEAKTAVAMMKHYVCTATIAHQPHWVEYMQTGLPRSIVKALTLAPPVTNAQVEKQLGVRLISPYGMTETHLSGTVARLSDDADIRLNTVGSPMPNVEMTVVDVETGEPVARGAVGEVLLGGDCIMNGYLDEPELTRDAIDPRGRYRTGDLGFVDERGCLRLVGRRKEIVRVGGENVSPAEVEDTLLRHPGIAQAVVVGRPDPRLGEVCVAVIQATDPALAADDVFAWCVERLARFKVPREVRFVTSWPMSGPGKIARAEVRDQVVGSVTS